MRIILDENISLDLDIEFKGHLVESVLSMGWLSFKNGELLKLIIKNKFDVLITRDRNLKYQQNLKQINLTILVLRCRDNRNDIVQPVLNNAKKFLKRRIKQGVYEIF